MKPCGSRLFFMGSFLIMNSVSLLVICLLFFFYFMLFFLFHFRISCGNLGLLVIYLSMSLDSKLLNLAYSCSYIPLESFLLCKICYIFPSFMHFNCFKLSLFGLNN